MCYFFSGHQALKGSQLTFTGRRSGVFNVNFELAWTPFSSVSTVDFKQVDVKRGNLIMDVFKVAPSNYSILNLIASIG